MTDRGDQGSWAPPPPPEAGPPGYGGPPVRPSNGTGTAALVLGIIGLLTALFLFGGVLGVLAVVLGLIGINKAKRGEATNRGVAIGGVVTGALAIIVALAVGALLFANRDEISDLSECVEDAGDDEAAQERCGEEFGEDLGGNE